MGSPIVEDSEHTFAGSIGILFHREVDLPDKLLEELRAENCLSKELSEMGFLVVESTTRTPIVVTIQDKL